ncbi:alpha-(1,3)-fucosyltransferase 4-like [Menidia menidia]
MGVGRSFCWPRRARYARALRRLCSCASAAVAVFLLFRGVCALYPDRFRTPPPPAPDDAPVTLLVWSHPFGRRGALPDCLRLYRIGGCAITDDASAYRAADAVIFHHREIASGSARLPAEPRPRAQKWIWLNYESPTHTRRLWLLEGAFNLTMSYRSDSDIFLPYGYLLPRARTAEHGRAPPDEVARPRPRRRLAAWVISNWSEKHARVAFYHRLRRYVQVDVFGRAGRPLPRAGGGGGVVRLAARYSFYLALENSQHTDYITEKLWNAVRAGAVPVVLGPPRRNYERFLPPEAFIHVDDFPTVRELARYLLALGRSPSRMRRHLDWRGGYSVHQPAFWAEHYCTACRAVRGGRGRTDVVQGLAQWFSS